jgi:hypothetical protein
MAPNRASKEGAGVSVAGTAKIFRHALVETRSSRSRIILQVERQMTAYVALDGRSQPPDRRHTHPTRDRRREPAGARLAALNLHIWRVLEDRLCRRGVGGLKIDDEINPVVFCVDGYTTVAFSTPNWYLETR